MFVACSSKTTLQSRWQFQARICLRKDTVFEKLFDMERKAFARLP